MIGDIRRLIAAEITAGGNTPMSVYAYKPDDINDVPCIVIDRPILAVNVQHVTFSTPVIVIGRRDGTEDAQSELDDATSWLLRKLTGPTIAIIRVEPATVSVADLTFPAYLITTSCGATIC